MRQSNVRLQRLTISAIFLSLSLVLQATLTFEIPLFGQNGLRVGLSGIFSVMPALLFGPLYGAVIAGLSDVLGFLVRPTGVYLPLMTLFAALGGLIRGGLWRVLHKRDSRKMRIVLASCSIGLLLCGLVNVAALRADGVDRHFYAQTQEQGGETDGMHLISRLLLARTAASKDPAGNLATYITVVTAGVIGSALLGILLLGADWLLSKHSLRAGGGARIPQLLITLVAAGLVVTTLNTILLRESLFTAWKLLPFGLVWLPRAIEELLSNIVKAYFIAVLLGVCKKQLARIQGKKQLDEQP